MASSIISPKRKILSRTKARTGCTTCRIRKVKCDETKPRCQKCHTTGRVCEGYASPFRIVTVRSTNNVCVGATRWNADPQSTSHGLINFSVADIDLLDRYFSIKTVFDVKLGCNEEASQVLQASVTDFPIRHAVSSLRAFREDFESTGGSAACSTQLTCTRKYGLQQYSIALGGVASNLSSPRSDKLRSTLLCCQIFISIEQVQGNFAAMAQHIVQGLEIMHEYHARPTLAADFQLMPENSVRLPCLDVYIIKLFAAPCKFAERPTILDVSETALSSCPTTSEQKSGDSRHLRSLTPDIRSQLTKISTSTLRFLRNASEIASVSQALQLLGEKAALLDVLDVWLRDLESFHIDLGSDRSEPLHLSFMRLFHRILKVILLSSIETSPKSLAELKIEKERLQDVATHIENRVKTYKTSHWTHNIRRERYEQALIYTTT